MARPVQRLSHAPASRARFFIRRASHLGLAGAASLAAVGLTAPAASAHGHNVWDRVAHCESTGNWHINTGNGFYGGLQFWHPTWTSFGGQQFAPYAHQATKLQQITVAQRVLQVQGPGAWPVCSVRAGLTLQNGSQPYPGTEDPAPPPPGETGTWWVSSSVGANIRSGPGTNFAVVGAAARGAQVTGVASNGWVHLADGRGWISLTTLTTSNPAPTPPPADPTPPPPSDPGPPAETSTWRVSAGVGANIRSGPGLNHGVVGGASHGTQVSGVANNGWVKLADGRGYISLTTLTAVNTAPTPPPAPAPPGEISTYRVSVSVGANIRSGPGTTFSVIGGAGHGTQVQGTMQSNGWVQLSDRSGWIYGGILTKVG